MSLRIREKKLSDGNARNKKREEELSQREAKIGEKEAKLKAKETELQ